MRNPLEAGASHGRAAYRRPAAPEAVLERESLALLSLWNVIVTGVVSTFAMDIVAVVGTALHVMRIPAYGRWFLYGMRGTFRHADIDRAAPLKGENALMLPLHYVAGILLATSYLLLLDVFHLGTGNFGLATAFGAASSLIPFLLMLPSMGYGLFGLRHARDLFWFRQIILMHVAWGIGLGIAVLLFVPG